MDIVTYALCKKASKSYTDNAIAGLGEGITFNGAVENYSDLPNNPSAGDSYIVHSDESTTPAGKNVRYVYGYDESAGGNTWISLSRDFAVDITTEISEDSTDAEIPTAKAVYDSMQTEGGIPCLTGTENNPIILENLEDGLYTIQGNVVYSAEGAAPIIYDTPHLIYKENANSCYDITEKTIKTYDSSTGEIINNNPIITEQDIPKYYYIDASNVLTLNMSETYKRAAISDQDLLLQLHAIDGNGFFDSNEKLKPIQLDLLVKTDDAFVKDRMLWRAADITDNTEFAIDVLSSINRYVVDIMFTHFDGTSLYSLRLRCYKANQSSIPTWEYIYNHKWFD